MLVVSAEVLSAARVVTSAYLRQHPVKEDVTRRGIEAFLHAYESVRLSTGNHDAAVYVGSMEARKALPLKTAAVPHVYPGSPGQLFADVPLTQAAVSAYVRSIGARAYERIGAAVPAVLQYNEQQYVLHTPSVYRPLVGLDGQQAQLCKYVRHLCVYDPVAHSNAHALCFPRTVLLTGPPGTGKSSLVANVCAEAQRVSRLAQKKLTTVFYDASHFSKYFGASTRALKAKWTRVSDPGGVGVFCVEDVDMVLQSRSDPHAFHGVLEVQQYLLNALSGAHATGGNVLVLLTTNRVSALDDALLSRVQRVMEINPFVHQQTHLAFWQRYVSDASSLAALSHAGGLCGRDLEALVCVAQEQSTPAPTDEQLMGGALPPAALDAGVLAMLIAERTAALRTRAV